MGLGSDGGAAGGSHLGGGVGVDPIRLAVLAAHAPVGPVDVEDRQAGSGEHTRARWVP